MYTLKIKTDNEFLIEKYADHEHYHPGDVGMDLFFPEDIVIPAGTLGKKVGLDIYCELLEDDTIQIPHKGTLYSIPNHYVKNLSFNIYPRSSISKTPLRLSNSIGLVDAGYRGELVALFDNHSHDDYFIMKGDRLLQVVAPNHEPMKLKLVNNISETERGDKGIGSSGK